MTVLLDLTTWQDQAVVELLMKYYYIHKKKQKKPEAQFIYTSIVPLKSMEPHKFASAENLSLSFFK